MERRCGTCKHWDARTDKRGRRIYQGDPCYRCTAPVPDLPELPSCYRVISDGRSEFWDDIRWPPHLRSVRRDDGKECTFWEPWK